MWAEGLNLRFRSWLNRFLIFNAWMIQTVEHRAEGGSNQIEISEGQWTLVKLTLMDTIFEDTLNSCSNSFLRVIV